MFYYPNRVLEGGEVVFDTKLVKIETSGERAEKVFKDAIALLNSEEPESSEECGFCEMR